jgi:hypothetical protein
MLGKRRATGLFVMAVVCLATVIETSGPSLAQQGATPRKTRAKRTPAKKSVARSPLRPKGGTEEKSVADRIVLRDGRNCSGRSTTHPPTGP